MKESLIKENCVRFGEHRHLAGIFTEPAGAPRAACVLVTAGLTPRSGPFRLYAQLARRLAREGLRVLRFDLGGIGDSRLAYPGLPLRKRTELELRAAVDQASDGARAVILGGLCSGAEDSFRYAALDARVTGLALIDPFGYPTLGWRWRDGLIRGARKALIGAGLIVPSGNDAPKATLADYRQMDYDESRGVMTTLIERGVGMHFVYTGGMRESFNHRRQFEAMFPGLDFRGLASVDYFPQLRHTQVLEADRRLVVESIAEALTSRVIR